ncbi:protein MOS2-like [Gastrolobium bilobum]|uniref:protein MOS2-like n=1 Tax=Gastrolobium bilobum TaxID=150636 RepID=UPI002AB14521|nr:protein MOS2-like [Gastrolobium bilobum]
MKLFFSVPTSKSKPNSTNEEDNNTSKQFFTEFDPSKSKSPTTKTLIIPPIQNEWILVNKMNNLAFEHDTSSSAESGSDLAYGLNLRRVRAEAASLQKLKDDLKRLPDDQGFDEFKDVPVEGFGAALLAGYGWSPGMGIGKNAKEDVKVVQFERRTTKEGLGFVRMVATNHDAELGSVQEDKCLNELKDLKIHTRDVNGVDFEVEEKRVDLNGDSDKQEIEKKEVFWLTSHLCSTDTDMEHVTRHDTTFRYVNSKCRCFIASHIRVRVISRDFKGGRLYLKKGEILDVVGPTTCDVSMDETKEVVQGVSRDVLETVIPPCGGYVLVLYGKHKGAFGSLVEKDLDLELGIVRDADTHELLNVKLEQIAEYVGDPSFLGY